MPIVSTYTRRTGPGVKSTLKNNQHAGDLYSSRQVKPYVSAPYDTARVFGIVSGQSNVISSELVNFLYSVGSIQLAQVGSIARARLVRNLIPHRAALGVSLASVNKSYDMIATRSKQLYYAYRSLKQLRFKRFLAHLGLNPRKYGRPKKSALKDTAGTWLEYTFGWVPLVADIYGACMTIENGPSQFNRAHGTSSERFFRTRELSTAVVTTDFHARCVATSKIKIERPNLGLAARLGLVNPAQVAWDLIPFSFVIDWFVKVNSFITSTTDMIGYAFDAPVTTWTLKGIQDYQGKKSNKVQSTARGQRRVRSLSTPSRPRWPTVTLPGKSLWLAATSTSLLATAFLGKR